MILWEAQQSEGRIELVDLLRCLFSIPVCDWSVAWRYAGDWLMDHDVKLSLCRMNTTGWFSSCVFWRPEMEHLMLGCRLGPLSRDPRALAPDLMSLRYATGLPLIGGDAARTPSQYSAAPHIHILEAWKYLEPPVVSQKARSKAYKKVPQIRYPSPGLFQSSEFTLERDDVGKITAAFLHLDPKDPRNPVTFRKAVRPTGSMEMPWSKKQRSGTLVPPVIKKPV